MLKKQNVSIKRGALFDKNNRLNERVISLNTPLLVPQIVLKN